MAGYVFAIGGKNYAETIQMCVESGVYSTYLSGLSSIAFEGTLADYMSMKPGDNIYFFANRKYYGIGELISVGPDCKYCNYPKSTEFKDYTYEDIHDDLLVDFGEDSPHYRWICTFKGAPYFFSEGIDTDEILSYKPSTFKMLRAFWKVSFIKIGDEENESLREIFLLRHQHEMVTKTGIISEGNTAHTTIYNRDNLADYQIEPSDMLRTCYKRDKVKHEMALEATVVYDLCHEGISCLGRWDYVSHQVVASPFKPIDYMDKIDVMAINYLPETKIPCKYLIVELKKDSADKNTINQVLKYVDWVCTEYAYGDYGIIEACIIASNYKQDVYQYYQEAVQRYYTLGSHPVQNKKWDALKLLEYTYVDGYISYSDVTPENVV